MFKHIIGLFKFSKLEVMGGQFFQWQFAEQQVLSSMPVVLTRPVVGQVLDPEFIQFKIDGFTMYTDIGQMSLLDDVLADIPGGFQAHCLNGTVHPRPSVSSSTR